MPILLIKTTYLFLLKEQGLKWINSKTIKNIKQKHVIETR